MDRERRDWTFIHVRFGSLSLQRVRFENLNVNLTNLEDGSLTIYDSASDQWAAGNELLNIEISQDGGFY